MSFFATYITVSALLDGTESKYYGLVDYFRRFFRNVAETIETQLKEISPLDRPLTRLPQCIEILLAHRNANAG